MSVLVEFAMFPTDKGESVSEYVSKIIKMIDKSGVKYELTPMGTVYECDDIKDALSIIEESYRVLEPFSNRVYSTIKMDIRKNRKDAMKKKIESIKSKM
ncbi:MAG: MTH1187 family thiamine-binding protein [Epsilonproteobacteria bacterium]|jgi:uncharacterized protein (TIGR00106 family)|nr:MTH1187 family thiamine-binding protein [Campylobacterota bacterium]